MRLSRLSRILKKRTPNVSRPSAVVIDFERAFGESEKRGVAMGDGRGWEEGADVLAVLINGPVTCSAIQL